MNIRFRTFCLALLAALLTFPPAKAQNPNAGGGDERTKGRRDIITRYVMATNNLAEMLVGLTGQKAEGEVKQRLENAIQRVVQIKNVLKSDRMENSPQVQELLKEKHAEIAQASAKLAAQVSRIKSMPEVNPELVALLDRI